LAIVFIPILLLVVPAISFAAEPIEEIQGLWIEADDCRCSVRALDKRSLRGMPVRCYHYFFAERAISGYIRLSAARGLEAAAQRCQTSLSLLNETLRNSLRQIENTLRDRPNAPLGVLRSADKLPPAIGAVPYVRATIEYSNSSRQASTMGIAIWDKDPSDRQSNHYEDGIGINFIYKLMVGVFIGRREGICSSYRKLSPNELYIGIHNDKRHSKADCESRRYRVLERYIRL